MRPLTVALCVSVLLSIGLPARATAASVEQTWYAGIEPFGVTIDPRDGTVYVADSNHNNAGPEYMWAIDPTVPMPYDPPSLPRFLLPTPQVMSALDTSLDRLYVPLTNHSLAIVDVPTRTVIATVPGAGGVAVTLDPATHHVFVAMGNGVALVDGATGALLASRPATRANDVWWDVAQDPVRHRLYVANGNFTGSPTLVVLDDSDLSLIADVPLPAAPRFGLSVDVARGLVYVGGFAFGSPGYGILYAIDESSLSIVRSLDVGKGVASVFSSTFVPESDTLFLSVLAGLSGNPNNAVVVVDAASFEVTQRIPVPFEPGQSALHPDGHLYVTGLDTAQLAAITFINRAPVIGPLAFSPPAPSTVSVLTANAQVSDPDGDPFTVAYEWRRNGDVIADASGPTLDLSVPGHGDRGDTLSVLVTASDGAHTTTRSSSVVVANALPALVLSMSSAAPLTNDLLIASASAPDADGDDVVIGFAWTRNGSPLPGATGPSLDLRQYGDKGDVLVVTATADDGHGGVTSASATATVADSPPVVTLATNTSSPKTNDTIVATATMSDADGDAVCCAWSFKVNGIEVWHEFSQTGATWKSFDLSQPGWGDRGDTVTVEATAGDRILATTAAASYVVVNSAPQVGVALSDYSPTKKDVLVAYGSVYDADGDAGFLLTYTWKVGQKVRLVVGPTTATSSSFDLRNFQPGDVVTVTVSSSSDGIDPSVPTTTSATLVANH